MDKSLAELIKISNTVGKDSSLVLGTFGNTSVKTPDGKYMYIKASGTALKDMTCKTGWRKLKTGSVQAILKDESLPTTHADQREAKVTTALASACQDRLKTGTKPSVESCFHSILDRCVIHLHPVAVLVYVCAKKGKDKLEKLFAKQTLSPLWVPYADIGYTLAKKTEKLIRGYKNQYGRSPQIIFLQNHGLVVTANSSNTALQLVRKAVALCSNSLKISKPAKAGPTSKQAITAAASAIRQALLKATGKDVTVSHFIDETIAKFMAGKDAAKLCLPPAITPDELVYARGPALWLDKANQQTILHKLNRRIAHGRELPVCFLIKPLGLFVAAGRSQSLLIKDVVSTYFVVRSLAAKLGGIRPLSKRQRNFIAKRESHG